MEQKIREDVLRRVKERQEFEKAAAEAAPVLIQEIYRDAFSQLEADAMASFIR